MWTSSILEKLNHSTICKLDGALGKLNLSTIWKLDSRIGKPTTACRILQNIWRLRNMSLALQGWSKPQKKG